MCRKSSKAPVFLIGGICSVIVLVGITGVTLINNINLSNIIRLNEKVASDSVSASDNHMKELNYANQHPKNIFQLDLGSAEESVEDGGEEERAGEEELVGGEVGVGGEVRAGGGVRAGEEVGAAEQKQATAANSTISTELQSALAAADDAGANATKSARNEVPSVMMKKDDDLLSGREGGVSSSAAATAAATAAVDEKDGDELLPRIAAVVWKSNNNNNKHNYTNPKKFSNAAKSSQVANSHVTDSPQPTTTAAPEKTVGEVKVEEVDVEIEVAAAIPALVLPESNSSSIDLEKRQTVVKMMEHAWHNYKLYAWGKNELRPLSQRPHLASIFGAHDLGATIVDGLDTLYLMGLDKEYKEGREWIERKLWLNNISADLSVFETNIRFVGGLLTLYAFTGDSMYRDRAQHVADKLLPAFQTPTGIPYALVNTRTGASKNYAWASGGSSILSELGTLHLEFAYLSDVTGNPLYRERVQAIRQVLKEIEKPNGLYPNYLNPKTGKWGQMHMSLGALGDSFYEYLLKAWLQSGQVDEEARDMFDEAMVAIVEKMVRTSPNGLTYVSDLKFDRLEHKMGHLACFAGGLFALGATTRQNENTEKFLEIGKGITNTCHESYIRTPTHLGPEAFRFSEAGEARAFRSQAKYYILRPETIESYFVLWRLTHDQKYRDWGWDAVQALERHCRTPHGYCGIKNVYQEEPQKDDVQQSFFLAETLKYLYLLFSDDSLLPLDEWVFNTEAHPLPIKGANIYYRAATTTAQASSNAAAL